MKNLRYSCFFTPEPLQINGLLKEILISLRKAPSASQAASQSALQSKRFPNFPNLQDIRKIIKISRILVFSCQSPSKSMDHLRKSEFPSEKLPQPVRQPASQLYSLRDFLIFLICKIFAKYYN